MAGRWTRAPVDRTHTHVIYPLKNSLTPTETGAHVKIKSKLAGLALSPSHTLSFALWGEKAFAVSRREHTHTATHTSSANVAHTHLCDRTQHKYTHNGTSIHIRLFLVAHAQSIVCACSCVCRVRALCMRIETCSPQNPTHIHTHSQAQHKPQLCVGRTSNQHKCLYTLALESITVENPTHTFNMCACSGACGISGGRGRERGSRERLLIWQL